MIIGTDYTWKKRILTNEQGKSINRDRKRERKKEGANGGNPILS